MSTKNKNRDDEPRRITIDVRDEPPAPNSTLIRALKGGERPKPGEPGTLLDRLGAEFQDFLMTQHRVAAHRRTAVAGSFTITIKTSDGPDGSHMFATSTAAKVAKIPAGTSMVTTDEDGDLIGAPPADEPLIDEMKRREGGTRTAQPMVGNVSNT